MAVLHELDADVIALQEADMRFGNRAARAARGGCSTSATGTSPRWRCGRRGMAWHGNAILVRRGIEILGAEPIALPTLEPRGAVCARLRLQGREFAVVGMHLDLSGLLRRQQVRAICTADRPPGERPAVMMGDLNEWSARGGALARVRRGMGSPASRPQLPQPQPARPARPHRSSRAMAVRRHRRAPQRARRGRLGPPAGPGRAQPRCLILCAPAQYCGDDRV